MTRALNDSERQWMRTMMRGGGIRVMTDDGRNVRRKTARSRDAMTDAGMCARCAGFGRIVSRRGHMYTCDDCNGTGRSA